MFPRIDVGFTLHNHVEEGNMIEQNDIIDEFNQEESSSVIDNFDEEYL